MKSADITPGWYRYVSNPNGRYGKTSERVYVFGPASAGVKGLDWWRDEAEADEEIFSTVPDPNAFGQYLRVPASIKSRRSAGRGQQYWLVGQFIEERPSWEYAEDENGDNILDENGDRVWIDTVEPAHWRFALVRAVTIIQPWAEYEAQQALRKAEAERRSAEIEAQRQQRAIENAALAAELTEFGLALVDVVDTDSARQYLRGSSSASIEAEVTRALAIARKVAEHTTLAVLTAHR